MSALSPDIYSISRLNIELHQVLKSSFPLLWVAGEVANLVKPSSGHIYFSLKDSQAQIRCALFRQKRTRIRHLPQAGEQIVVRARIALYEPRGDCQLIIEQVQPAGEGQGQYAFEQLKQKLQAEGLFEQERKHPLPLYPDCIGLITSPSGAAVQDIVHVLQRRYPCARVLIYPTLVQGAEAPAALRQALQVALQRAECDVLILARGGGSQEDLAAFNDENLARQIAQATIPLVSAVGHEIDFTLVDFVADQRAPTPSAAAELVTPDQDSLSGVLRDKQTQLQQQIQGYLRQQQQRLAQLHHRLQQRHPDNRLRQQQQRLDEIQHRLYLAQRHQLQTITYRLGQQQQRLRAQYPGGLLHQLQTNIAQQQHQLTTTFKHRLQQQAVTLQQLMGKLHALSPLATLQRGYSIVRDEAEQQIIHRVEDVRVGDSLGVQLQDGALHVLCTSKVSALGPGVSAD